VLHHDMHQAAYVDKLNTALEKAPDLQKKSALWLLLNLAKLPDGIRETVHNNAGGHVNHSLFWKAMSPTGGGEPSGALADAITRDFGSFDQFKVKFDKVGAEKFGSGWVWLVKAQDDKGTLDVITTSGHDNPLMEGRYPLLLNDVWEHAYYLKHENRRADYLKNWWSVANWQEAARRFAADKQSTEARR
jgi:superoxide dismutase, Fe-Mn family